MITTIFAFFKTLPALLAALPEIIKLIQAIQDGIKEGQIEKKVAEQVKTIHEAYRANDIDKINAFFDPK